jgi:DNA-directed RNA polymerase specialized sigma24 family protein
MANVTSSSTQIQLRLDRLRGGDRSARDERLDIACERLSRLARKMLRGYPDAEREVFGLRLYQGLSQAQAAALLEVTERVVRYRWRSARLKLHAMLGGRLPE